MQLHILEIDLRKLPNPNILKSCHHYWLDSAALSH